MQSVLELTGVGCGGGISGCSLDLELFAVIQVKVIFLLNGFSGMKPS